LTGKETTFGPHAFLTLLLPSCCVFRTLTPPLFSLLLPLPRGCKHLDERWVPPSLPTFAKEFVNPTEGKEDDNLTEQADNAPPEGFEILPDITKMLEADDAVVLDGEQVKNEEV